MNLAWSAVEIYLDAYEFGVPAFAAVAPPQYTWLLQPN